MAANETTTMDQCIEEIRRLQEQLRVARLALGDILIQVGPQCSKQERWQTEETVKLVAQKALAAIKKESK